MRKASASDAHRLPPETFGYGGLVPIREHQSEQPSHLLASTAYLLCFTQDEELQKRHI